MKNKISDAIGSIDEKFISEAAEFRKKPIRKNWIKIFSAVACVIAVCSVILISQYGGEQPNTGENSNESTAGERRYKNIQASEDIIGWKWEYMTFGEKFPLISFNGKEYFAKGKIEKEKLGERLGSCSAEGEDLYNNESHIENIEIFSIPGASERYLVAAGQNERFYVYQVYKALPQTLGEALDGFGLANNLTLGYFTEYNGYNAEGHYLLQSGDSYIWQTLDKCRNAELLADRDAWNRSDRSYISFSATSEELGIYKMTFSVTADGYLSTNIFSYAAVYYIGEEAAGNIISYAKENSEETEYQPYEYFIAGTVTEIGDGYITVDDTALCVDENDGTVFRIQTENPEISRYIKCGEISVGDIIVVGFRYKVDLTTDRELENPVSIQIGKLVEDGLIAVEE